MPILGILPIKSHSSPGPDNISAYFLKTVRAHIASPLTRLINVSLDEGCVPSDWKKAVAVPNFKKKTPKVLQIYKSVSLTSVVCKILERVIRQLLIDYSTRKSHKTRANLITQPEIPKCSLAREPCQSNS